MSWPPGQSAGPLPPWGSPGALLCLILVSGSGGRNQGYVLMKVGVGTPGLDPRAWIDACNTLPCRTTYICPDMLYVLTGSSETRIMGVRNLSRNAKQCCCSCLRQLLESLFEIVVNFYFIAR